MISDFGWWKGSFWRWFYPKSNVMVSGINGIEEEEASKNILCEVQLEKGAEDKCIWVPDAVKKIYVQSFYKIILQVEDHAQLSESTTEALDMLWDSKVPSKVKIFNWRLLLDKLPTRNQLIRMNVISDIIENCCPFCTLSEENMTHLFFNCNIVITVWKQVLLWMDRENSILLNPSQHFLSFYRAFKGNCGKNKESIVRTATTWSLWRMRNNLIFNNVEVDIYAAVFQIKLFSWLWLILDRKKHSMCSFYDWCKCPLDFLS